MIHYSVPYNEKDVVPTRPLAKPCVLCALCGELFLPELFP